MSAIKRAFQRNDSGTNNRPGKFNSFGEPLKEDEAGQQSDPESNTPKKDRPSFNQFKTIIKQHKGAPTASGRKAKLINPADVTPRQSSHILEMNRQNEMRRTRSKTSQPGFYVHPSHKGTDYMRKRAQKKIVRTRIDGTVASSPLFVPYGAPGVDEINEERYENNQRSAVYIEGRGEDGQGGRRTAGGASPFPGGPGSRSGAGYYSDADIDGGRRGRGGQDTVGAAGYRDGDGSEFRGGAGGGGLGPDGRPLSAAGSRAGYADGAYGGTYGGGSGVGGGGGGGYGPGGVDVEYQGDGESSYDESGNPMVGGTYNRNGGMKQRYIIAGMKGATEVNVDEESSAYDEEGNPAPITVGVKINRKVFKYDSGGRVKPPKSKAKIRTKKGVGIGSRRSKAQMVRGTSGADTGSASTMTRQKSLLDYYKMAEVDVGSHNQDVCAERENSWILRDPYSDDDDDPNVVKNLSYRKVKDNEYFKHPRNRISKTKFSWWSADLKYFPLCCSNLHQSNEWVTPCAKEIGIGPTMFLLTNKAFAWLFLFLFLLNVPLMLFYQKGAMVPDPQIDISVSLVSVNVTTHEKNSTESGQFTEAISWMSLGNLGTSAYTCANFNFARHNNTFIFNCNYGTMRFLTAFGIQKTDNQTCETQPGIYLGENNAIEDLQYDCDFERGLRDEGKEDFKKQFDEHCKDQKFCELVIKYSWFNLNCRDRLDYYSAASRYPDYAEYRQWDFYQRDGRIREPVIFGVALCVADKLYNPLSGEQLGFTKAEFSYVLIVFDAIVVITTIWFINFLSVRMRQYKDEYDKQLTQMSDFSIKVANLPFDHEYGGKESLLQCALWCHLENVVKYRMLEKAGEDDETKMRIEQDKFWEISDVTFVKNDTKETDLLKEMDDLERAKCVKIKAAQDAAEKGQDISAQTEPIVELIKEYKQKKAEFIHIQEDSLYRKWVCADGHETDCNIAEAFITFRSMRGAQVAREVLSSTIKRHKASGNFDEYFYGRPLTLCECVKCESLIWDHLPYTPCNRCCRRSCVNFFAFILILCSFMAMIYFSDWEASLKAGAGVETKCPEKPIDAEIAYFDWDKPSRQRQGFMHCYCIRLYNKDGGDIQASYDVFKSWNSSLTPEDQPCEDWKWIYERQMWVIILAGVIIALINVTCVLIFELVVTFEKYQTYEDQTIAQYTRITMIQVLNIAFILLLAEFNLGRPDIGFGLPMLMGKYKDFDTVWYQDVGVKITIVMLTQSFGTFGGRLFEPLVKMALRAWDRYKGGCKWHLRKKTNVDNERKEKEAAEAAEAKKSGKPEKAKGHDGEEEEVEEEYGEEEAGKEGGDQEYYAVSKRRRVSKEKQEENLRMLKEFCEEIGPDKDERVPVVINKQFYSYRMLQQGAANQVKSHPAPSPASANELYRTDTSRVLLEGGDAAEEEGEEGEEGEEEVDEHAGAEEAEDAVHPDEPQTDIIFQDDLNELYMGTLAKVFFIYASFFTNLLVYYMYGGGIPLMWGFGAIFFTLAYIAYKFMFIWFHQITYGFDHYIPILSISMIKWALLLHICMVLFMYTDRRLLTPPNYTEEIHYRPPKEPTGEFFRRRFKDSTNWAVLIYVIIMFALYFIYRCLVVPISICISWNTKTSMDYDADTDREDHSDDIYKELRIYWLKNLYVRANKDWEVFRTMLNSISYDQEKLTDDGALIFKQKLRTRIANIEETIDIHLNSMGGLENNTDKTYIYKLAVLAANEDKIKAKDPTCQRMVDMIQSYYIYASIDYAKINLILKRIDRELMELSYQTKEAPVYV